MKGMSLEQCINSAREIISQQGKCLLLFDVKDSKSKDRQELGEHLEEMMKDLNQKFQAYFPEHNLAVYSRKEKGFQFLLGDGSWTAINSAEIISLIIKYQREKYPLLILYWGVAKDGYDEPHVRIVK